MRLEIYLTRTPVTPTEKDIDIYQGKTEKFRLGNAPKFTEGDEGRCRPTKAKFVVNGTVVEETTIDATKMAF